MQRGRWSSLASRGREHDGDLPNATPCLTPIREVNHKEMSYLRSSKGGGMQPDKIPCLRGLALFQDAEPATLDLLMRGIDMRDYPSMSDIICEGDPASHLHIVLSGEVELYSRWNGRETSMDRLAPPASFIIAATIRNGPYLMSARTIGPSRIALLPSEDVRTAFAQDGGFARAVVEELAQAYRSSIKTSKNLKLRSSVERLANYLLRRQSETGVSEFDLPLEKRQLASLLGMTPENMSRAIRALRPNGAVFDGARVQINDQDALRTLARPNPLIDDPAT